MKSLKEIDDRELQNILAEVKRETVKIFGDSLVRVVLFGSYARDEQAPDSDIDIMLLVDKDDEELGAYKYLIADLMGELSLKYCALVSLTEVPYRRYKKYVDVLPFYGNIKREGVEIYGRKQA